MKKLLSAYLIASTIATICFASKDGSGAKTEKLELKDVVVLDLYIRLLPILIIK